MASRKVLPPLLLLLVTASAETGHNAHTEAAAATHHAANYANCWTRDKDVVSLEKGVSDWTAWAQADCHTVCPRQRPPEESQQCDAHAHESAPSAPRHNSMFWYLMSVPLCLVMGAVNRVVMPSWIPYTVSLLIEAMLFGIAAASLEDNTACPMHALQYYDTTAVGGNGDG